MNPKVVRGHQPDYVLAVSIFALLGFGLVIMYSISPVLSYKLLGSTSRNYYFYGQLLNVAIGLVAWGIIGRINYQYWKSLAPTLMVVALLALVALLVPGLSFAKNGATRWLKLGPASFQPAELLKLATVLYLAAWFERRKDATRTFWDGLVPFSIMLAATAFVLVVLQRDMGTMAVLAVSAVAMYYVAGAKLNHLGSLLIGGLAAGWALILAFPHRVERLATFLDPSKDPTGVGYHISQALIAIGAGGILGRGLGKSLQIYGYLPEAPNDSIFAVIGEEFGLIGSLALVAAFGFMIYRGLRVARNAPDTFSRLVATGITLWLGVQALVNIAAMLSLVPLTGIPLPFISYGGSSLVISMIAAGVLLNISRYTVKEESHADNRQRGRDGWSRFAGTGAARRAKVAR